jgi:eukaryotic-like serine/threonine-protein kinase
MSVAPKGGRRRWSVDKRDALRALLQIVGVAIAAFLLGYLATWLMFRGGVPEIVAVPDLRNASVEEARRTLRDVALVLEEGPVLAHPTVPEGAVIAQSPLPGQEVAPGSVVRVNVSAGPEQVRVPDVTMFSVDDAQAMLRRAGFEVNVVERPAMDRLGRIVELQPASGVVAPVGSVVTIVVSSGPPMVEVPALVGLREDEAADRLHAAGLHVGETRYDIFVFAPIGQVVAQHPAPGDSVQAGTGVRMTIAGSRPADDVPAFDGR